MSSTATIQIDGHLIGPGHRPFLIAEMSGNHNQSLDRAMAIIDAAADAGAHAIKLQTYTADTMTLDVDAHGFRIDDERSLWQGASLYKLYEQAHTPWDWHAPIFEHARRRGLSIFSTPFDETAVDFLESLNVPCYKIASFENTDLPLIRKVASTGKPVIISTGMASLGELDESVRTARAAGCRDLILLKCTSTYPADARNTHLNTIAHMQQLFDCQVGLSDHTMGVGAAVASVALGATVIEKHFTLARADGGVDSQFSLEPAEFAQLAVETERAWQAMGQVHYGATDAEKPSLQFRRSLYVVRDLRAGDVLGPDAVRAIRPGFGLPPKHLDQVIGRRVRQDVTRGTPLSWSLMLPE
ncbi:pseudaminic acid synthase [Tibeticola sp.]|uniref:pseudaminic acid synthase n=1 Tax=Tibeticola sp. TaxID=2005368 RepID=UPI0025E35305|nr:pseudaminic acid synthase [Tibeticola sp.]